MPMKIPNRLIISRTDSIGDVILTLPMAGELKRLFPEIKILFLGASYTLPIVECCPYVDNFVNWTEISCMPSEEQLKIFKGLHADAIIHVFPRPEIARLAKDACIPIRIGTSHRIYHWFTCNIHNNLSRRNSELHESQLNLQLLKSFGHMHIPSLNDVRERLLIVPPTILPNLQQLIDPTRYNLILHPKSKGSAREWTIDHFCKLVELLPSNRFKIFLCGTANEKEKMGALLNKVNENFTDLCGQLTLSQYIAFIAASDALVAASTGPLHIAAAVGIHAVGIYPPMRPIHPGRWAPIGKDVKVFCIEKQCNNCRHTTDCECMKAITPKMVASDLIASAEQKSHSI